MNVASNEIDKSSIWLRRVLSELSPDLFKRFITIEKKAADDILPFTYLPDFTDHGIKHAIAVQANLAHLIPQDMPEPLTPFELFSLLSGTLLHDVGMAIKKSQNESARDLRADHYNRSREFVLKNHEALNLSEHEAIIIGEICRAHGMPNLKYLENEPFSISGYGDVRVPLISALLRLADALDITADRTPYLVSKNRTMPHENRKHWNLHKSISNVKIQTAPSWDIIISSIVPKKYSIVLDLFNLRNSIQNELDTITSILRAAGIFFKKVDLELNRTLIQSQRNLRNPFTTRLASFKKENSYLFAGRDKEIEQLLEIILGRNLVMLIGESGVGKTSLVEAGIIPRLRSYKFGIVRFSFQNDPIGSLIDNLYKYAQSKKRTRSETSQNIKNSRNLLHAIQHVLDKRKDKISKLIIIGDHLEQMFTVHINKKDREDFLMQFSRVLGSLSPDRVSFLFCIRQDYLPDLYDLSLEIPELYERRNIFKLQRLSRENSKLVFERASENARVKMSGHLIDRIVDELGEEGEGMVYPPFLQIVGYHIYAAINKKRYLADGLTELPESIYESLGTVQTIVKRYLDGLLDNYPQQDKVLVGEILKTMVTDYYTKRRVTLDELKRSLPHCHKLEELLKRLVQQRIVRPSLGEYELISDFLAYRVIELIKKNTFLSRPVRKALEYIEKHYNEYRLTSGEIAEAAGVTHIHLANLFRKQLGRSINYQLNATRIAKAKEKLSRSRDSIASIANETGYIRLSTFSRKFKEIDGASPLAYRKAFMETQQTSRHSRRIEQG